jgi:hypothetical protein
MKHLMLSTNKNHSDEAMKRLTIEVMKHLTLHRLASLQSTLFEFMQKSPYNSAELTSTYVKAKLTKFFGFATENMEFLYCQCKSSLHRFFA